MQPEYEELNYQIAILRTIVNQLVADLEKQGKKLTEIEKQLSSRSLPLVNAVQTEYAGSPSYYPGWTVTYKDNGNS